MGIPANGNSKWRSNMCPAMELSYVPPIFSGDAPDFVEVGEAGIAVGDAMRRERRVQLVG